MQTVLNEISTVQLEKTQEILQVMADKYSRDILSTTQDAPKSALKLAQETGIPISTVYRRLQFLQENKMLKTSGGLNKDGKYFVYLSKLKTASTYFDGSEIWVSVTPNLNFTIN